MSQIGRLHKYHFLSGKGYESRFGSEMCAASRKSHLQEVSDPRVILHGAVSDINPGWWGLNWLAGEGIDTLYTLFGQTLCSQPEPSYRNLFLLSSLRSSLKLIQSYMVDLIDMSTSTHVREKVIIL